MTIMVCKDDIMAVASAAIEAVKPASLIPQKVLVDGHDLIVNGVKHRMDGRVFVIGAGKASGCMASAIEEILGERIEAGIVNTLPVEGCSTERVKQNIVPHPIPDERTVAATEEILSMKEAYGIGRDDTVICLVSGGGSAMLENPLVPLDDMRRTTELLIKSGATIEEINTVRRHISAVKGGRLGLHFSPARVITLIISDVLGNSLPAIASGPTTGDSTTFDDAIAVLEKYGITDDVPGKVRKFLSDGAMGREEDTPDRVPNCTNHIIGDISLALEAAEAKAVEMGFKTVLVTSTMSGDTESFAVDIAGRVKRGDFRNADILLAGGETTPRVPHNAGKGGRNMHYAAVTLMEMLDYTGEWCALAMGTDGVDYMPGIAGGMVSSRTADLVRKRGIPIADYVRRFDSYTLLSRLRCLLKGRPTGTNVGDVVVYGIAK